MAPTEILAEQHYRKLARGSTAWTCEIAWLAGRLPAKARKKALAALASGDAQFAVGTHALFQEGVEIPQLGLAIVDEQHRFGVAQRLALRGKGAGRGAPADDERDADPAHAGDDVLRRPRRVGDRRDAAGPHAGGDAARQPEAARARSSQRVAQAHAPKAGRRTGCAR